MKSEVKPMKRIAVHINTNDINIALELLRLFTTPIAYIWVVEAEELAVYCNRAEADFVEDALALLF